MCAWREVSSQLNDSDVVREEEVRLPTSCRDKSPGERREREDR